MRPPTPSTASAEERRLLKARALLSGSFEQALRAASRGRKPSAAAGARWTGVHEKTVRRWLALETEMSTERVLASPQLRDHFRRALCTHDHAAHANAPYVASRASARRKTARKGAR